MKNVFLVTTLIILLILVRPLYSQENQQDKTSDDGFMLGFEIGYQFLDGPDAPDRLVFAINPEFSFSDWGISFKLQLPLEPETFSIPKTEFDELSDFAKIVKYIRYGKKLESDIYFKIGALAGRTARIGHGTIFDYYFSEINFDSRKIGLQFDWDEKFFGFEAIVNSFTDWNVLGFRAYARPFARSRSNLTSKLKIAATFAADFDAPISIDTNEFGIAIIDEAKNIQYKSSTVNIIALDVEMPIVHTNLMQVVPYFDFVQFLDFKHGFFGGLRNTIEIPILGDILPIELKLEWHELASGFLPAYFNAFYEIERFNYPKTNSATTKLKFLENAEHSSGWFASLQWGIKSLFWMRSSFSYYDNDPKREKGFFIFEAATEAYFNLSFMFIQRGIEGTDELFKRGEKSIISGNFGYPLNIGNGQLTFGLTFERSWRLNDNTGHYESIDCIMPYISYKMRFSEP